MSEQQTQGQTETTNPVASSAVLAADEPPADFGSDEISMAMKPKRLKRYSMVNTTTSHAFMREDPAGDWVAWSEAANDKLTDRQPLTHERETPR